MTRDELVKLIEGIISGEFNDNTTNRSIAEIERNVAHPFVNDVLISPDFKGAEAKADELLSWKAQALPPPSGV